MKINIITFALAATLTAVACSSPESPPASSEAGIIEAERASRAYHAAHNIPSHGVALEGYCPVAYFAVNKPVRGKPEYASEHGGITYYLVSAEAKVAFDASPEKYLPAYGGWCAFGMSVSDKFPVDPRNFEIVDGRLMLFLKNPSVDARELWNQGERAELVRKANVHWQKVRG